MKRPLTVLFFVALAALAVSTVFSLSYGFVHIWAAFAQAPVTSGSGTEQRLLLATMLGSSAAIVVSLLTAIFSAVDRSRSMRSDRTKKAHELSTEAGFAMWKAATVSYRLLQRADDAAFSAEDQAMISKAFQEAETATLLVSDDEVRAFQRLWSEAEAIAGRLLACGQSTMRSQSNFWAEEYPRFPDKYKSLRLTLKRNIGA